MLLRTKLGVALGSSLLVTLVACGGADPSISDFNKAEGPGANDKDKLGGGGDKLGGGNGPATGGDLATCATQTATAEARPVYLVFMFDKSGSMTAGGSPKWSSSKAATKAFFESADSKGISASLSFFPDQTNNYSCNSSAYRTPNVAMAALPNTALGAQSVPLGGGGI